jgi:hypothetical protein
VLSVPTVLIKPLDFSTPSPSRFVALKISVAEAGNHWHEAHILKLLSYDGTVNTEATEGSQHVLTLLDNFQIRGPNGTHEVFVTEVVAPLSDFERYPVLNKVRLNGTVLFETYLAHLSSSEDLSFIKHSY